MLKKLLAVVLVFGFVAEVSCAEDKVLRFSWWGSGDRHEATLRAIHLFETKNPGVKIKSDYSAYSSYAAKFTGLMANGSEPDIMQINWAWLSQYSKDGNGFYDLNNTSAIKKDQFINDSWKSGVVNGKLNALPVSYSARVFLWNKTTWSKAGLALPRTWEELFAAGKVFETKLGKSFNPIDVGVYDRAMVAMAYITQKTGKQWIDPVQPRVALSEAEALEWIRCFNRMATSHVSPVRQGRLESGGVSVQPSELVPEWVDGHYAGTYTWDTSFKARTSTPVGMAFEVGDFLSMPGAKNSGYFGRPSMMLAVSKRSKNPEIAAKFVNWMLTDPNAIQILGSTRGAPTSKAQLDVLIKKNTFTPLELKALKQLQSVRIDLPNPLIEHQIMQKWIREVFDKVSSGAIDEATAAKMLVVDTNAVLLKL